MVTHAGKIAERTTEFVDAATQVLSLLENIQGEPQADDMVPEQIGRAVFDLNKVFHELAQKLKVDTAAPEATAASSSSSGQRANWSSEVLADGDQELEKAMFKRRRIAQKSTG